MNILKTVSSMALAFATMSASAELLWWQVQDAAFTGLSGDPANFTYATVRNGYGLTGDDAGVSQDAEYYYHLYTIDAANAASQKSNSYKLWATEDGTAAVSSYGEARPFGDIASTVNTLLFELWDGEDRLVGYSFVGRNQWSSALTTLGSDQDSWNGTAYTLTNVVPEPTSGLLLLLGMAGLALRRKRRA